MVDNRPEQDVSKVMKNLLENNWDTSNVEKPEIFIQSKNDNKKRRNRKRDEFIKIHEDGNRNINYSDLQLENADFSGLALATYESSESREKREKVYSEVERILIKNRKNYSEIGQYDNIEFDTIEIPDENHKSYSFNITVLFSADSRKI